MRCHQVQCVTRPPIFSTSSLTPRSLLLLSHRLSFRFKHTSSVPLASLSCERRFPILDPFCTIALLHPLGQQGVILRNEPSHFNCRQVLRAPLRNSLGRGSFRRRPQNNTSSQKTLCDFRMSESITENFRPRCYTGRRPNFSVPHDGVLPSHSRRQQCSILPDK